MKKWILRIALGLISLTVVGMLSSYVFVDRELSKMYGGHTQVADFDRPDDTPASYVLSNVNVLTPSADSFLMGQTVLISGGNIRSVGMNVEVDDNLQVIDASGKFLLPGYTDSHVHLWESENDLLLYLANGVTQIRDMNSLPVNLQWKKEIVEGRPGPDIFTVAPQFGTFGFIEGTFVGWTQHKTVVRSEKQIKKAVKSYAQEGYDAVKASSFLDQEGYRILSAASKELNMPMVGHIPIATNFEDVWSSNQTEIAHVEELMKKLIQEFGGYNHDTADAFLEFVRNRSDDVADQLKQKNISVASTLSLIDSLHKQKSNLDEVLNASELEYENPGISEGTVITSRGMGWLPDVNIYKWPADWGKERRAKSLIYWKTYSAAQHIIFNALLEKNVLIMAATDANVPVMVPGFSLHGEMKVLNDAGMSTAQVLASATANPGEFMKTNTGEISPGFKANLVLLNENPLEDISATDTIEMVISNGRMYSRDELDAMLQAVANENNKSRTIHLEH